MIIVVLVKEVMQMMTYDVGIQRRHPHVAHQMILRKFPQDIDEFLDKKKTQLNGEPTDHVITKQEIVIKALRLYMKKHPLPAERSKKTPK